MLKSCRTEVKRTDTISGDRGPSHAALDWPTRLNIIEGITEESVIHMISLLHQTCPIAILNQAMYFLDPIMSLYLQTTDLSNCSAPPNTLQALFAYKAPEAAQYGMISLKCDIYCLGILILKILTRKFPSQYLHNSKGGTDVVEWVISVIAKRRESELFDPEITSSTDSFDEMEKLLHIGTAFTETNPELRLDMREATRRIDEIQVDGNHNARPIQVFLSP